MTDSKQEHGSEHGCMCEDCCDDSAWHKENLSKSEGKVISSALEFTFIDGSADYSAQDRAQALNSLHAWASIHRRNQENVKA